jgi:hypothetical protein
MISLPPLRVAALFCGRRMYQLALNGVASVVKSRRSSAHTPSYTGLVHLRVSPARAKVAFQESQHASAQAVSDHYVLEPRT